MNECGDRFSTEGRIGCCEYTCVYLSVCPWVCRVCLCVHRQGNRDFDNLVPPSAQPFPGSALSLQPGRGPGAWGGAGAHGTAWLSTAWSLQRRCLGTSHMQIPLRPRLCFSICADVTAPVGVVMRKRRNGRGGGVTATSLRKGRPGPGAAGAAWPMQAEGGASKVLLIMSKLRPGRGADVAWAERGGHLGTWLQTGPSCCAR